MTTNVLHPNIILGRITRRMEEWITDGNRSTEKFTTRLAENPADALRWADDYLRDVARLELATSVMVFFERFNDEGGDLREKEPLPLLREFLLDGVLQNARHPARSTSVMSNLMEQERLAAKAMLFSEFLK